MFLIFHVLIKKIECKALAAKPPMKAWSQDLLDIVSHLSLYSYANPGLLNEHSFTAVGFLEAS